MDIATTTDAAKPHSTSVRAVPPQDPDHDIDAKKTATWLIACTVFVFVAVGVLYIVFSQVIWEEYRTKVELPEPAQIQELRAQEAQALSENGGIEQSMREYVESR